MSKNQLWITGCFFALAFFCAGLLVLSDFLGASIGSKIADVASDGLKITISALVGALSASLGGTK
jgi:hypothetical protein